MTKRARPPHGPPLRQHHHDGHRRPLTKVVEELRRTQVQKSKIKRIFQSPNSPPNYGGLLLTLSQVDKLSNENETENLTLFTFFQKNAERICNFKAHWRKNVHLKNWQLWREHLKDFILQWRVLSGCSIP